MATFIRIIILIFGVIVVICTITALVFELLARYEKDPIKKQKKHKTSIAFGLVPMLTYAVVAILWVVSTMVR